MLTHLYTGLCVISFGRILMNDWGLQSVPEEQASTSAPMSQKNFVRGIDSLWLPERISASTRDILGAIINECALFSLPRITAIGVPMKLLLWRLMKIWILPCKNWFFKYLLIHFTHIVFNLIRLLDEVNIISWKKHLTIFFN